MSSFAQIEKELIVKYVKGVALFLVLCFATYGAFALFKKPTNNNLSESQRAYLGEIGIDVTNDGQAADSGLSPMFGAEGVAPVGAIGTSSSSAPPSFLVEPTTSFAAPFEPAPRVASVDAPGVELQPAPEFSSPEATVLPPLDFAEPAVESPTAAPPFLGAPPISAIPPPDPSPPPPGESWDGPVIPVTPPPAASLQSLASPTQSSPLSEIPSPIYEQIAYQPIGQTTIRRIASEPEKQGYSPTTTVAVQDFSTLDSVLLATATQTAPAYTRTAARQSLSFEPVKPEIQPNAPVVSFSRPKQIAPPQPQPEQIQPPLIATSSVPAVQSVTPAVVSEIEKLIQSQRILAESGNPENMRRAFIQLSQLYEHNQLGATERAMMQPILDMLALKVIYAKDTHILEPPHRVKPGETVESIAKDFNLTPTLLCKINGLTVSQTLPAGTTLKVLYGQFDAQISTKRRELTLLLGGLYAGRFSCSLPQPGIPMHGGEFYVTNRSDRSIVLNNGWILGTSSAQNATIVFTAHDAREIFDILSEQSVVVVE